MARRLMACLGLALLALGVVVSLLTDHSYVTTPSMYPTIPPGSEIFVSHTKDVHVGQVIEFRANGLVWAHRLIRIRPDGTLVTKGDNPANAPDVFVPPLTRADVIGAVTHAPKWLGFPQLILNKPGYGLAWLRAELGLRGKLLLSVAAGLAAWAMASRKNKPVDDRQRRGARRQQHRAASGPTTAALPDLPDDDTTRIVMSEPETERLSLWVTEPQAGAGVAYGDAAPAIIEPPTAFLAARPLPPVPPVTRPTGYRRPPPNRQEEHAAPSGQ